MKSGPLKHLTSVRTALVLLCVLAFLLFLNVVIPQAAVMGDARYREMLRDSSEARFFLETLALGRIAVSPIFLITLGLFFVNLTAVLAARIGPTWRRVRMRQRSEAGLQAWARTADATTAPLPEGWALGTVVRTLMGFGYKVKRAGEATVWGVRYRTAPLGFLLFHVSFFLLFAGGALLYYTRFVGSATLAEGQTFTGDYLSVARQPPFGGAPELNFRLDEVETRYEAGQPVHLGASFRFRSGGGWIDKPARINYPAVWGNAQVLVRRAGLSPTLWLQDADGFTLDRVVVAAALRGSQPTVVPLADESLHVLIFPLKAGTDVPDREGLATTPLRIEVLTPEGETLYAGNLRSGQAADWQGGRLVIEEMRYWLGFQVIAERGGGLLIAGFVLAVIGLVWRMLWYRRQVAVTWDEASFRLVGHSEYYSWRFREELAEIHGALARGPDQKGG